MLASDKSYVTTDDEFYNELLKAPLEFEDCLIPDQCPNELKAHEHLTQCLHRRYGSYPAVYMGSLKDAVKEAFSPKEITERRPLMIFINNDKSVYANIFCKQLLCNEKTVEYLMSNYILWAWDLTHESNEKKLNDNCKNAFLSWSTEKQFQASKTDQYPSLFAVYRETDGSYAFHYFVKGPSEQVTLVDFLRSLSDFKEKFTNYEQELHKAREETKQKEIAYLLLSRDNHRRFRHDQDRDFRRAFSMAHDADKEAYLNVKYPRSAQPLSHDGRMTSNPLFAGRNPSAEEIMHAFEQFERDSDDADDEDDDRTPTVLHPKPKFP
ncbi:unnamed protein product [Adineta ricciae]|uniref:UAS domain-containing protein n=1 Tax=Adineta ricciae TaxID=249248 RepID=A0A814IQA5_ADIRI|nr:unnamed protein product [Adineta ricciae]